MELSRGILHKKYLNTKPCFAPLEGALFKG
nr:MAG TPA: hypothetical protein [Caudoviricetes sp.]